MTISIFEFGEGTDGFVRIEAKGTKGWVVANAIKFQRVKSVKDN